jgi:predicted mannosyl-3-phosphoglycerate phosphatase (HAD superfamily)
MNKVSEITVNNIANYIRLTEVSEEDKIELQTYLNVAKNYISNYTGIPEKSEDSTAETLDSHSDFIIVIYALCQDMYDNRTMYVDNININKMVQTILDMHRRNNL